jgi:trehalose-6-phosphate synthase
MFCSDQKLTSQVHEIVGRINGRFGTLTAVPIHHLVGIFKHLVMAVDIDFLLDT